ncbi:phage tail assembly chaperone [Bradyrhizobium genosp. SA-3]|uniref:phage tail assembly chaperone n=1 Tax=Bradyrhizobium genosp. SA-3 TaxID=508868 RepID=UPI0013EE91DB|nr:phage tail assembly chaperone [Bradyrhizobium genosp. SA-3]
MRLAANTFALQLGSRSFDLKPSLRAAFILYERYDGFHNLSRHLAEGSLTAALDIISATIVNAKAWGEYALPTNSAIVCDLMAATGDLIEFVMLLAGADDKASDKPQAGKPIPFDEWFTSLFEIGTGWLSWPPETVWDATPAEILAAQRGRVAMLKAIFGGKDDQCADVTDNSFADLKADLNAIGDLTNHSRPR